MALKENILDGGMRGLVVWQTVSGLNPLIDLCEKVVTQLGFGIRKDDNPLIEMDAGFGIEPIIFKACLEALDEKVLSIAKSYGIFLVGLPIPDSEVASFAPDWESKLFTFLAEGRSPFSISAVRKVRPTPILDGGKLKLRVSPTLLDRQEFRELTAKQIGKQLDSWANLSMDGSSKLPFMHPLSRETYSDMLDWLETVRSLLRKLLHCQTTRAATAHLIPNFDVSIYHALDLVDFRVSQISSAPLIAYLPSSALVVLPDLAWRSFGSASMLMKDFQSKRNSGGVEG